MRVALCGGGGGVAPQHPTPARCHQQGQSKSLEETRSPLPQAPRQRPLKSPSAVRKPLGLLRSVCAGYRSLRQPKGFLRREALRCWRGERLPRLVTREGLPWGQALDVLKCRFDDSLCCAGGLLSAFVCRRAFGSLFWFALDERNRPPDKCCALPRPSPSQRVRTRLSQCSNIVCAPIELALRCSVETKHSRSLSARHRHPQDAQHPHKNACCGHATRLKA